MTITSTETQDGRVLTVDQRANFLRELAEHVENEARWAQQPFTEALPRIVPAVASGCCPDPLAAFNDLVDAIEQLRQFNASPADYADAHDWSTRETALDRLMERLESNVDAALQRLLGGES